MTAAATVKSPAPAYRSARTTHWHALGDVLHELAQQIPIALEEREDMPAKRERRAADGYGVRHVWARRQPLDGNEFCDQARIERL